MLTHTTDDYKIQYLQMIEDVITRMSSTSAIIKGFTVTIAVAICSISVGDFFEAWLLWLFVLPILSLITLDIYYLSTERKYRYLYKNVCEGNEATTFSLTITNNSVDIEKAKARFVDCLKSIAIWLFYAPILLMYLVICIWVTCFK